LPKQVWYLDAKPEKFHKPFRKCLKISNLKNGVETKIAVMETKLTVMEAKTTQGGSQNRSHGNQNSCHGKFNHRHGKKYA
jgi:hypothetical protein